MTADCERFHTIPDIQKKSKGSHCLAGLTHEKKRGKTYIIIQKDF